MEVYLMIIDVKLQIKRVLRKFGITTLPEIDGRLATLERVFRAPPLTRELVAAIKLISPQFDLATDERSREYWEADQNGACWGEFEALAPLLNSMPQPDRILEIGPGLGRSLVFFSKKMGWKTSEIHAYEGEGSTTKYTILGPRFEDSFCGNIGILNQILEFNAINNVMVFNARDIQISQLPAPYDFLYSFYCIGFHWSLEHFIDDLLQLMNDASVAVFTVPYEFKPFPKLETLSYKIVTWKTVWPKDGNLKLLVFGKKSIPNW